MRRSIHLHSLASFASLVHVPDALGSVLQGVGSHERIASVRPYAQAPVCPDCKQIPRRNRFDERWQCRCNDRVWPSKHGSRGEPEEHAKLTKAHFQMTTDTLGDTYYVGPLGNTAWLYEDGTWRSDPDTEYHDLDKYLAFITTSAA